MTGIAYAKEKFSAARSTLMLPHVKGEAMAISCAFFEMSLGLAGLDRESLDDDALRWVGELDGLMNADGLEDPDSKGLLAVKAETLTYDQKHLLSRNVDSLCMWFRFQLSAQ